MFRLVKITTFVFVFLFVYACGQQHPQTSQVRYAHKSDYHLVSTPLGRLEIIHSSVQNDIGTINICVKHTGSDVSQSELMLETRLAFVSWLEYSGVFAEIPDAWQSFSFNPSSQCEVDTAQYNGVVRMLTKSDAGEIPNSEKMFREIEVECIRRTTRQGTSTSCPIDWSQYSFGLGGPGHVLRFHQQNQPSKWSRIEKYKPSFATFSPMIKWVSLSDTLATDRNVKNKPEVKQLIQSYIDLKSQKSPSLQELRNFVASLQGEKIISRPEYTALKEFMADFRDSKNNRETRTIRLERPLFQTMLHEVGHVFGMSHADDPVDGDITGQTFKTWERDGEWITSHSIMAYSDPYLYLTDDDQAGIKAINGRIKSEIKARE